MNYINHQNSSEEKKVRYFIPVAIFLFTLLMIPIGGTNYLQILFAVFCFFVITVKKESTKGFRDDNITYYSRYYLFFIFISVIVGLIGGVDLRTQLADILTSTLPLFCMQIGSFYAMRYEEKKQYKLFAIIIIIELIFGFLQNINEGFRSYTFELYDSASRLISYQAEDVGRAVGTLKSPNYYGIICVTLGTVFIGLVFDGGARKKITKGYINLFLAFAIAGIVVLSVSKTSVICISVAIVLCALFSSSLSKTSKFFIFLSCVVAVFVLIPIFEEYSNRTIDLSSMSGRSDNWIRIIELGFYNKEEKIFLGYGNGFSTLKNLGIYADSFYILLLFEQGIVGALAYFITWIAIIVNTIRRKPSIYKTYTIIIICIMLMADVTAAVTDMPIACIIIYYLIGRYSTMSLNAEKLE